MKHLKPEQYYIDLYDRHTVERCRGAERSYARTDDQPQEEEGVIKEEAGRMEKMVRKLFLRAEAGERYLNKSKAIREWMDADRNRDELLDSTQAPEGIRCLTCRNIVKPTFNDLWLATEDKKPERVLFMYDCPNECLPRRAFFSDGEEYRVKPDLCPRCDVPLEKKSEDDGKKLTTTRTCLKCGYSDTDEFEWSYKKEDEFDPNFAADRDRFCLTTEEGQKYWEEKSWWERMAQFSEEIKKQNEDWAARLAASPNGFILEGVGRTCAICGDGSREGGSWYDSYGLKCFVCQKAIDVGDIPATLANDKESWYSKYNLESAFSLKGPTLKKWVKDGVIKSRVISYYGKGTHCEIFLIEDNKGFLPPKEMVKSHSVSEVKDVKTWHHSEPWYRFVDPMEYLKDYGIIKHMRVVPPEEMAAREEEKKRKWEEKQERKKQMKK